jgi:hypothetical protein
MTDEPKYKHKGRAKKGEPGRNPKGRPPILHPEIQRAIDQNRNAVKELILKCFGMPEDEAQARAQKRNLPMLERMLWQCIERTTNDGDVDKFRKLLEIPFGRLPEEPKEMDISPDEKLLIITYRQRLLDEQRRTLTAGKEADHGDDKAEGEPE